MRLRERKIGPYKYPTIDRTRGGREPRKTEQSTQKNRAHKTQPKKNTKSRTKTSTQNRVKNQKKQGITQKKYIHRKGEKGRGESRISPVFVPARKQLITEPSVVDRKQSNPHRRCSLLHHSQKRKAVEPHQRCSLLRNLQKQVCPFPFVFALLCSNCI